MAEYKLKPSSIEKAVVGTYKKIEHGVIGAYQKIETKFVDAFLEEMPPPKADAQPPEHRQHAGPAE